MTKLEMIDKLHELIDELYFAEGGRDESKQEEAHVLLERLEDLV